ncbi:MAG: hypothetical protein ABIS29_17800 [Vicinamibacterales bacterium]
MHTWARPQLIINASTAGKAREITLRAERSLGLLSVRRADHPLREPVTVTPSTDAVDAGGRMSVSWTAPGGNRDWITLFKVGGRSYDDDWYDLTNGATSGTRTLTAPTRSGQYEFRYLVYLLPERLDDGFLDLARSSPVTVR